MGTLFRFVICRTFQCFFVYNLWGANLFGRRFPFAFLSLSVCLFSDLLSVVYLNAKLLFSLKRWRVWPNFIDFLLSKKVGYVFLQFVPCELFG